MKRAVFLDRDGVLTEPVWNDQTAEFESPHYRRDVELCEGAPSALKELSASGYLLFMVSNQPSFAKGKVQLKELLAIAELVEKRFKESGVFFRQTYYCFHHPDGTIAEVSGACACRKPEPYFLLKAAEEYDIDLGHSWMLGDRRSDIECGRRAGCRTVLIKHPHSPAHRTGACDADYLARNLREAAELILAQTRPLKTAGLSIPTQGTR